jgi:hypothetical protein
MKRPYIPVAVRLRAAELQALYSTRIPDGWWRYYQRICYAGTTSPTMRLHYVLESLFAGEKVELDHNPALRLRKFNRRTGRYMPDANDPRYLTYRLVPDHDHKTFGRKPGASRTVTTKGSDTWLAKKFRKLERPQKLKRKIPSRPFGKSRSSFATSAAKGS